MSERPRQEAQHIQEFFFWHLNINTACSDREQGQLDLTYDAKGPQDVQHGAYRPERGGVGGSLLSLIILRWVGSQKCKNETQLFAWHKVDPQRGVRVVHWYRTGLSLNHNITAHLTQVRRGKG